MNGWGLSDTLLGKIVHVDDFWILYDELCQDKRFRHVTRRPVYALELRERMLRAYELGHLYGLRVLENEALFQRGASGDAIFARNSSGQYSQCLLPCFCFIESGRHSFMWTHTRARRIGLELRLFALLCENYDLSKELSHSYSSRSYVGDPEL